MESKLSESQKRANKKWIENNREHSNYLKNRSACKSFIRNKATSEDLKELSEMILQRKIELLKNKWYNIEK